MAPITLVFCLFLFMFTLSSLSKKTYDDEMTLLEFKSSIFDPNDVLKSWRDDNPNHCSWFGVSCNSNLRVSELKIQGNLSLAPSCLNSELSLHGFGIQRNCSEINGKLVGKLSPMIGNLTDLTVLSLPFNELDGEIPVEILGLKNLQVLDLEGNSLDGHFSSYEFTRLRKLRVLNLAFNRIYGQFPPSLPKCRLLRILNLAGNRINGTIPTYVGGLRNLRVINLSFNRLVGHVPSNLGYGCGNLEHLDLSANFLNGEIPRALGKCNRLRTLLLSSNALNGTIPKELRELRRLEVLDVSRNNRSGPLPEDLGNCTNTSVAYLSFFANQTRPMDRGSSVSPIQQCERHNKTRKHHSHHKSHDESDHVSDNEASLIVLLSFVISLTITSLACIAIYCYAERRRLDPQTNSSYSSPQTSEVTIFHNIGIPLTYDAIVQATQNFSRNCIGAGGFGSTYKAEVSPENVVAIKRLTASRHQGVPQFDAEVSVLGRINHPNLITLIGYYASQAEMFLIYNYLPGGNLDQFIRNRDRHAFDYNILHKISLHIAFALSYLHDECNPRILHRDIKPSNILLDEDYNAYLSDFGLSRILNTNVTHATTRVAGTYGYIAPEYASTGRVSSKADVYSYGVVLLELMSDKRALDPSFFLHYNGFDIVSWVRLLIEERRPEEFFMARLWESGPRDKLIRMLFVAILCTNEFVAVRPPMKEVVRRLEQLQPPTG